MNETELKPCPFCGGKAEIHIQPIYIDMGVCIRCTVCGARSKFNPYDCKYVYYNGEKDVYISQDRATNDVKALWNRRSDNEKD